MNHRFQPNRFRPSTSLLLVFLTGWIGLPWPGAAAAAEPASWKSGCSKVVITPREPVWMAGYAGRNGPSDGVLTDLYARVIVLVDASQRRLVMVSLDLIEIPGSLRDQLLEMALKKHGLKPEELLLNVSHTHGGPMVSGKSVADWGIGEPWRDKADQFARYMTGRVDAAIASALAGLGPAKVSYSHARCGFAMNRRVKTHGGYRLGANPDGPVDHDVPLLKIEGTDGRLVAVAFGYACHNTALGPTRKFNGDYAGFAQKKLEHDHPGTTALFLSGCGGDQDPSPRRNQDDAELNGLALASAVEAGLVPTPLELEATLVSSLEVCPLPFAPLMPKPELEARARSADGFVSRHANWVLKRWPNPNDKPADYPLPVQVVSLGGKLLLVALGGEPVVDYSIRLKAELALEGRPAWIAGYSNLVSAYVPSRRVLLEGGYEGSEAVIYQLLPAPFRVEIEEKIVESVRRQATRLGIR